MSGLKDICLQVRYEGKPASLIRDFYAPVSAVTSLYRIRTTALTQESLFAASLGLSQILASGKPVRFLVAPPMSAGPRGLASTATPTQATTPIGDLVAQLKPLADAVSNDHKNVQQLAARFDFRIAQVIPPQPVSPDNVPTTTGFFTDESGATVSYQTEANEGFTNGTDAMPALVTSWSWGDPQFKVRTAVERFEILWNGDENCAPANRASVDLSLSLLKVLLHIEQNPMPEPNSDAAIRLFRHQQEAVDEWKSLKFKGVFKMCTGAGKTISALAGVHELAEQRAANFLRIPPVIVSVPTRVLADQWIKEIRRFGFRSIVAAYNAFDQWSQLLEPTLRSQSSNQPRFIVTTYRTFSDERFIAKLQRAGSSGIEALWIADEMHNLASPRLRDAMRQAGGLFKFRLGLSATPEIEGDLTATEQLLDYFGGICASYELRNGIEDGVLCPHRYHPVPAYLAPAPGQKYLRLLRDIQDTNAGSSSLMNLYRETRELLRTSGIQVARFRDLLHTICRSTPEFRHTLIYCPPGYGTYGGEQSDEIDTDMGERRLIEEIIQVLRDNSLTASSILGETPGDQRAQILQRFGDGRLNALCAIGCLDEGAGGFDFASR
jgi:superfamily II DNA or RNA helicase